MKRLSVSNGLYLIGKGGGAFVAFGVKIAVNGYRRQLMLVLSPQDGVVYPVVAEGDVRQKDRQQLMFKKFRIKLEGMEHSCLYPCLLQAFLEVFDQDMLFHQFLSI